MSDESTPYLPRLNKSIQEKLSGRHPHNTQDIFMFLKIFFCNVNAEYLKICMKHFRVSI